MTERTGWYGLEDSPSSNAALLGDREKVDLGKFCESYSNVYMSLPKMNPKSTLTLWLCFSLRGLVITLFGPAAVELVQVSSSHVRCTPNITAESHLTKPT